MGFIIYFLNKKKIDIIFMGFVFVDERGVARELIFHKEGNG